MSGAAERWADRIDALDLEVYGSIPSQTTEGDRRALLAVQRATAKGRGTYSYLEIGSHLGGSLQPHVLDARCRRIYSIDPRPEEQPDERASGHVERYQGNSTERMLALLDAIDGADVDKIECFESDASDVLPGAIQTRPEIVFIDGEHTDRAVRSDFQFAMSVVAPGGTVLFHDYWIIHRAISHCCRELKKSGTPFRASILESNVFAIFLDRSLARSDAFLAKCVRRSPFGILRFKARQALNRVLNGA